MDSRVNTENSLSLKRQYICTNFQGFSPLKLKLSFLPWPCDLHLTKQFLPILNRRCPQVRLTKSGESVTSQVSALCYFANKGSSDPTKNLENDKTNFPSTLNSFFRTQQIQTLLDRTSHWICCPPLSSIEKLFTPGRPLLDFKSFFSQTHLNQTLHGTVLPALLYPFIQFSEFLSIRAMWFSDDLLCW